MNNSNFKYFKGNDMDTLKSYGFKRVGKLFIKESRFIVEIEDEETTNLEKTIYVFVIDKKIMRIGSSKGVLKRRFRSWERDVTKRLQGCESSTPQWEAEKWQVFLQEHGEGIVFARQGTEVRTLIGTFLSYLDEESILIGRHLPPLNRSKHR